MSKSTEDRRYFLRPDQDGPYYQMVRRDDGWQWLWIEFDETEDVGHIVGSRAEALLAAARDAEDCILDGDAGRRLANRLRAAARAVRS